MVTASVVSHKHGAMVEHLMKDLSRFPQVSRILLAKNIPEAGRLRFSAKLIVRINPQPQGYGANHNASFRSCLTPFFCVLNPDILLRENPFPALIRAMKDPSVGVCAPTILAPDGTQEDSHRQFPDFKSLLSKALGGQNGKVPPGQGRSWERNSWLAGMFLFCRTDAFREIGGFDEKFFLYYEDVDLCDRLIRRGYKVRSVPSVSVIHDARRQSRWDLRYALWHLRSMARFLRKRAVGGYPSVLGWNQTGIIRN